MDLSYVVHSLSYFCFDGHDMNLVSKVGKDYGIRHEFLITSNFYFAFYKIYEIFFGLVV